MHLTRDAVHAVTKLARLRFARRLRRRAPRRLRRSSSARHRCNAHPPTAPRASSPFRNVRHHCPARSGDDTDDGRDAGADRGDVDVADGVDDGDAVDGADAGDALVGADDESGRVASRPGYTLQSPCGRFPLLSLAPPRACRALRAIACPAARFAHRRCRDDTLAGMFGGIVHRTAVVSRRRFAPRSSRFSPRSCGRSCGAPPHFAPHRAVQKSPHDCGRHRFRLRQRAAHDCLRLWPHRPPLNRRGGSHPSGSPASIPPSLIHRAS